MSLFIIRFDDITRTMAWSKFAQFQSLLDELNIIPIIGVVPNCLDPSLFVEETKNDFWEIIRNLSKKGWTIAQHGYEHLYETNNSGVLGINNFSEFAGLPYNEQFEKLRHGKEILVHKGIWQPVFMAPAHSFDTFTLTALTNLGFKYITDGYGVYPYFLGKIQLVPNLFSSPKHFGFGIYTMCLHINTMTQNQIDRTIEFIKNNRSKFITFDEAILIKPIPVISQITRYLSMACLRSIRRIRKIRREI